MSSDRPLAYRRGWQDFYGRKFKVDERVLIPRPETEQMVDLVLDLAGKAYLPGVGSRKRVLPEHPCIIEVGTGSGCVAVTLALELPEARIMATDISPEALGVARENAYDLGVTSVEFVQADLLNEARMQTPQNSGGSALEAPDCVVANLPYVSPDWEWISPELKYEPAGALFAADNGLELIKKLIAQVAELGVEWLVLEADPCQHAEIKEFAHQHGLKCREVRGYQLLFQG